MTVEKLIKQLQKYPPDTPVRVHQWLFDEDGDQYPADVAPVVTSHKKLGEEYVLIKSEFD